MLPCKLQVCYWKEQGWDGVLCDNCFCLPEPDDDTDGRFEGEL